MKSSDEELADVASAAAMREALKELQSRLVAGVYDGSIDCHAALKVVEKALAAPARNCDVGTPKEQEERFKAFCASHWNLNNTDDECAGCPLNERAGAECEFAWVQMPYEEKGEGDGKH